MQNLLLFSCLFIAFSPILAFAQDKRIYSPTQDHYAEVDSEKRLFIYNNKDEIVAGVPNMSYQASTMSFVNNDSMLVIGTKQGKTFIFDITTSKLIAMPDLFKDPETKFYKVNTNQITKVIYSDHYKMIFVGDTAGNVIGYTLLDKVSSAIPLKLSLSDDESAMMGVYDLMMSEDGMVLGAHFARNNSVNRPMGFIIGEQIFEAPSELYQGPKMLGFNNTKEINPESVAIEDKITPQKYQSWIYNYDINSFVTVVDTAFTDYANFSGLGLHKDMYNLAYSFKFENRIEIHLLPKDKVYKIEKAFGEMLALNGKANAILVGSFGSKKISIYRIHDGKLLAQTELSSPPLSLINIDENGFVALTESGEVVPVYYDGELQIREAADSGYAFTKNSSIRWHDQNGYRTITFGDSNETAVSIPYNFFNCDEHFDVAE
ncbi:MAG: hypothetical protein JNM93_06390 [Bacteriovoracaceae bacterium]|nr:hypothetical protein [Bacteriovoracaceae bacterium]